MRIRTILLAGVLSVPLVAGAALAAGTGDQSLVNAAKQGDRSAVQSLLNGPAKQDAAGAQGAAALIWAASRNDVEMADILLRAGADPKAVNEYNASALYAAANHADPSMAKKLLAAGADPNVALGSGETPLMVASREGHADTVRALLEGGADPNAKEKNCRADVVDVGDRGWPLRGYRGVGQAQGRRQPPFQRRIHGVDVCRTGRYGLRPYPAQRWR